MAFCSAESHEHRGSLSAAKKLRVLILASEWGSSKGGLSTINRELAIYLAKHSEVLVTFFVPECNDRDKSAAKAHNIDLLEAQRIPGMDNKLQWLSSPPHDLQIDIVVGHGVKLGPQARVISINRNCIWVQVVHTAPEKLGMHKEYPNPISSGEKKHETEVELCEIADFVVTIGPELRDAFCCYLSSCKTDQNVFCFTPGVFSEFSKVAQVSERSGKFQVLLVGRGDAEDFSLKGFDIAAKAVAMSTDTHLIFVGAPEGEHDQTAQRFLDRNIPRDSLTVRGFSNRESLKKTFCEVDLAIMPSRTEGFGLTGLEALSAGLPILVSQNSGFGQALSKIPFGSYSVVNSNEADVWSSRIKDVKGKSREVRLKESKALRASYGETFSWERQIEELVGKMITLARGPLECQSAANYTPASSRTPVSTEDQPESNQDTRANEEEMVKGQSEVAGEEAQLTEGPDPTTLYLEVNYGGSLPNKTLSKELVEKESAGTSMKEFPEYLRDVRLIHDPKPQEANGQTVWMAVECHSLEMLERLWHDFCSGHLNAVAEKMLLTDDIKERFHVESISCQTTVLEEDYLACKEFLSAKTKSNGSSSEYWVQSENETITQAVKETQVLSVEESRSQTVEEPQLHLVEKPNTQGVEETEIKSAEEKKNNAAEDTKIWSSLPPVKLNAVPNMTEKNRAAILELMKTPANNTCADCTAPNPEWASASMGLFICMTCSGIHRNLGAPVSVVKSLRLDTWTDEKLKFMEEHGNNKGRATWAKNVPVFYRRPKPTDPHVLKEQWIRAKYERKEFVDGAPEPSYLNGSMRGYLRKKGKEDSSWNLRLFVLSANENSLSYFTKDQDEKPKCTFKVSDINVTFAQERTNKDNSLQITYVTKGLTRNYFVYSDSGKEIVDWYMAIRSAKLKIQGQNGPGIDCEKLNRQLTRDFTMEGFLDKRGPKGEPWQKRWFSLDGRRLLYLEKPLNPFAKGELIIGSHTEGFAIQEGAKSGKDQDEDYCFTLTVPRREYLFKGNTENERKMWIDCISKVIAQPMTDKDKAEMKDTHDGMKKLKSKSFTRSLRRSSFVNDEDSP